MKTAVAIYDCVGDDVQELTFKKGDILVDVSEAISEGDGWLKGRVEGTDNIGLFPENYVKILTEEYLPPPKTTAPSLPYRAPSSSSPSNNRSVSDGAAYPRPMTGYDHQSYRPVQKVNAKDMAAATRQALLAKSNNLAKTAREKATGHLRESSASAANPAKRISSSNSISSMDNVPSPVLQPSGIKKSSSINSNDSFSSIESRRVVSMGSDHPPVLPARPSLDQSSSPSSSPNPFPAIPKRPPLLVSNQTNEPPPMPSRDSTTSQYSPNPPTKSMPRSFSSSSTTKSAPPRPSKPTDLKPSIPQKPSTISSPPLPRPSSVASTNSPPSSPHLPSRPLKPSEIRAQFERGTSPAPETSRPSWATLKPAEGRSSSTSRGPSPSTPPPSVGDGSYWAKKGDAAKNDAAPAYMVKPAEVLPNLPPSPPTPGRPRKNPFLGNEGTDVPPRPTSHAGGDRYVIPADALKQYDEIFDAADTNRDGLISADDVRKLWMRSGLDKDSLAKIWSLTDKEDRMALNKGEFGVGMFLIDDRLKGHPIPDVLPASLEREITGRGRHIVRR